MAVTISGTTGLGVGVVPTYPIDVTVGATGTTAGSQVIGSRIVGNSGNTDLLEISNVRGTAGVDWQTAGWRIQQKVDATWMGYIQFNGTTNGANNSGISIGTGSSIVSANSVTERLRIDGTGNVGIANPTPAARLDIGGGTADSVQAIFTRGVSDSNFQIRAVNGVAGSVANTLMGEFGLVYAGTGDAATINFYRGAGAMDGALAINTNAVERLRVDAVGRVTMPAQPAFSAQHALSTATVPSEIIWGTAVFNIGGHYSTTTGRFTAPVAGTYFFRAHTLTANANAGESRILFYKNGAAHAGFGFISNKTATTWKTIMGQAHIYLAVGDYVSVFLTAIAGSLYNDPVWNNFSGHLVG